MLTVSSDMGKAASYFFHHLLVLSKICEQAFASSTAQQTTIPSLSFNNLKITLSTNRQK